MVQSELRPYSAKHGLQQASILGTWVGDVIEVEAFYVAHWGGYFVQSPCEYNSSFLLCIIFPPCMHACMHVQATCCDWACCLRPPAVPWWSWGQERATWGSCCPTAGGAARWGRLMPLPLPLLIRPLPLPLQLMPLPLPPWIRPLPLLFPSPLLMPLPLLLWIRPPLLLLLVRPLPPLIQPL